MLKTKHGESSTQHSCTIRCGFCGHEFAEEEGIRGCGRCGKPGGCHMVRCPRCFYENPPESKLAKKVKKLLGK